MSNNPALNIIVCIGALLVLGLICSFFVILNIHKEEIWQVIIERYIKGGKDDR